MPQHNNRCADPVSAACLCPACAACRLTVNTGSGQGNNTAALPQELAGFDFETGMQALDTPTFSKSGSKEAGGSFTCRLRACWNRARLVRAGQRRPCAPSAPACCTAASISAVIEHVVRTVGVPRTPSHHRLKLLAPGLPCCRLTGEAGVGGRRRTTWTPGGVDSTTGGRLSNSSERATPPIGSSSGYGYVYGYSSTGPAGDAAGGGQPGSMQEEGGGFGGGSSGQGRQVTSLASRLSQQALSEIRDRCACSKGGANTSCWV